MTIKLGEKIRELRKKTDHTQETLASLLGVTPQAISRWESGVGYPDMEMIPSIANAFHVTIDELFGYESDREKRINDIINTGEKLQQENKLDEAIALLRDGLHEFPDNTKIMLLLGFVLTQYGWQNYGLKGYSKDGSPYTHYDVEYNASNVYLSEVISIFEHILDKGDIDTNSKTAILSILSSIYPAMGKSERMKELANKQDPMLISREILLAQSSEGKERSEFVGKAILELLRNLVNTYILATVSRLDISRARTNELHMAVINMYETLFEDGNFGPEYLKLYDIHTWCMSNAAHDGDYEKAREYLRKVFEYYDKYVALRNSGTFKYTSAIFEAIEIDTQYLPMPTEIPLNALKEVLPEEFLDTIKDTEEYARLFEQ